MNIKAVGKFRDSPLTVECEKDGNDLIFSFNGKEHELLEDEMRYKLSKCYPIGGSYCPDENSALNAYNVLKYRFFDELTSIEIDGEIETIPYEEGKIY